MGGEHSYIGFIDIEDRLKGVDSDIRKIVNLSYYIPGFGAHGVSCSGHFNPSCTVSVMDKDYNFTNVNGFDSQPFAHLGFAFMPEIDHVAELLKIIRNETKRDPDCKLGIQTPMGSPKDYPEYESDIDLRKYQLGTNHQGLYVVKAEIRLGDNGALDSIRDRTRSAIKLEGNELAFELSQQRCGEIQEFWRGLEHTLKDYIERHKFNKRDLTKKEFLPFY